MRKFIIAIVILMGFSGINSFAQKNEYRSDASYTDPVKRKELLIPNAFTPNNDGQNDFFKIKNITDEKIIDFKVFNRWGTILFRTTDPNLGWDGTNKGQPQPVGVYGYVIQIGYPDGNIETYKGTVTLLK
ncbi:gliding motility-associated C-terminal domain-containing protein [Taibaiella lutea]|uniref:Gliding motility-associated C-terminal domain-containing protein n=1 Tax=Taibaiella lutea TaxID=2608001 RepID=A0A5M6CDJ0_9BACT|nr:gliding motility-associated C-terminal domain-containing protein [Taibaiella lutea]KAA5533248.1 gliding motility-associated C-terminal domain-containing protein [Taibaiella lutea]